MFFFLIFSAADCWSNAAHRANGEERRGNDKISSEYFCSFASSHSASASRAYIMLYNSASGRRNALNPKEWITWCVAKARQFKPLTNARNDAQKINAIDDDDDDDDDDVKWTLNCQCTSTSHVSLRGPIFKKS